jgi:hypothetical protein
MGWMVFEPARRNRPNSIRRSICKRKRLYSARVSGQIRSGSDARRGMVIVSKEEHNVKERLWRCTFARVMAIAVVVALVPLPVLAGENSAPPKPGKTLTTSIASAAAREAVAATRSSAVTAQAEPTSAKNPNLGTWGFFKTPLGIGVVVVLAAGAGYAAYGFTSKGGRIRAPGR